LAFFFFFCHFCLSSNSLDAFALAYFVEPSPKIFAEFLDTPSRDILKTSEQPFLPGKIPRCE
jgi:hypothetical protein